MIETFRDDVLSTLTAGELDFLYFAELHLKEMASWTLDEAASCSLASAPVIERACKKLGLSGYSELRYLVRSELKGQAPPAQPEALDYRASDAAAALVRESHITMGRLSEEMLARAAETIRSARNLVLFGRGLSEFPAEYLSEYLGRMGRLCRRYLDPPFVYRDASHFAPEDAIVIFSSGGRTIPVVKAAAIAKKNGAAIVAVCSDAASPLARMATITLDAASDRMSISRIDLNSRFTEFLIADALVDELLKEGSRKVP